MFENYIDHPHVAVIQFNRPRKKTCREVYENGFSFWLLHNFHDELSRNCLYVVMHACKLMKTKKNTLGGELKQAAETLNGKDA